MTPREPTVRLREEAAPQPSLEDEILGALTGAQDGAFDRWLGALWSVGAWLRSRHRGVPPTPARPDAPDDGEDREHEGFWEHPRSLPTPHRVSLAQWDAVLARGETRLHGPLGLDRIHLGDDDAIDVVAPRRAMSGDPAADVGGVVADLLRLQWQAGRLERDPRRIGRLVSAFTTSYCGLPPDLRIDELALRRAIALRTADRAAHGASYDEAARVQALVEQAWLPLG